jgi:phospholipase/carboxylesterase
MGFAWFSARFLLSDRQHLSEGIASAATRVADLIQHLKNKVKITQDPVICGFSQGGMISFAVAANHPETVQAAIPISGVLPAPIRPQARRQGVKYPKIRALHGATDTLIPLGPTRQTVDHLKKIGFDITLQVYPGVGHVLTDQMQQDLYRLLNETLAH